MIELLAAVALILAAVLLLGCAAASFLALGWVGWQITAEILADAKAGVRRRQSRRAEAAVK